MDVIDVDAGHTYHCPGNRYIERVDNSLIRFFFNAIPSVSNLGSVVLSMVDPRPGYWVYVKCKPGSSIREVPKDKITDQWQKSPDGKSRWVNAAGWPKNPKRNLGVYALSNADIGYYLRALIMVEGYEGTLKTEPVQVLRESLRQWQCEVEHQIDLVITADGYDDDMVSNAEKL